MSLYYKKYDLDEAAVDVISADVQEYLKKLRTESTRVHRVRLTVEELLLNILEREDRPLQVSVGFGKQFGRKLLRIRYDGRAFDPTTSGDDPFSEDIMRSIGLSPSWNYRSKINTVSLVLEDRPKRSTVFYVLASVLSAVLLGLIGNFLPETLRQSLNEVLLTPLVNAFLGLLRTFSGLMIALTVCNGILGMGDSASFGRMGKSSLTRFILYSFAICLVATPVILPFVKTNFSAISDSQTSPLSQLSDLFFDILPSDIVTPFQNGNALQIIVIAVIVGIGLISIGERGSRVRGLLNDSTTLAQHVVSLICALVPAFIFIILLRQIWSGQVATLISFHKPIIISVVLTLVLIVIVWLISALRLKCPPMILMKKILAPSLIAYTTASSMAALPLAMEIGEKDLGIQKSTISFIMPLGLVIYMPASIINLTVIALTFAEIYQIEINLIFLIMVIVVVPLCAIALPPIPGAGAIVFTILFSSLGIPAEAIAVALAMDIIFDFFDTGSNVMLLMLRSACEAKKHGKLDQNILLSR